MVRALHLGGRGSDADRERGGATLIDDDKWDDQLDDSYANERTDDTSLETEAEVDCPFCGETVAIMLDPGGGSAQDYVQDCGVCCRPWRVRVHYDFEGAAEVWVEQAH